MVYSPFVPSLAGMQVLFDAVFPVVPTAVFSVVGQRVGQRRIPAQMGGDAKTIEYNYALMIACAGELVKSVFPAVQTTAAAPHPLHQMVGKYINKTNHNKVKAFIGGVHPNVILPPSTGCAII